MDLIEFLRARLDEDEYRAVKAQAVIGERWESWVITSGEASDHLVINANPARVMREVDAQRRIVKAARLAILDSDRAPDDPDIKRDLGGRIHGRAEGLLEACSLLASTYASHPDYQTDWKP